MSHDIINKAVTIARVASLGFALWREIQDIAGTITLIAERDGEEEMLAYMNELDELDPNSREGLAWRMIKAWANDPANDWLEHI